MSDWKIGGIEIPDQTVYGGETYLYNLNILGINGNGEAFGSEYRTLTWTFKTITQTEFDWWCVTILGGELSKSFSGNANTKLFSHRNVLTNHDSCTVYMPSYMRTDGQIYQGVSVLIDRLITS